MREAEKFRYLVLAAQREGNRQLAAALGPLGVTPAQSEVVRILSDNAPMSLTDLGRMLVCESGTNPSRLVDKLVTMGLVRRQQSLDDRRQLVLELTERGATVAAACLAVENAMYSAIDAAVPRIEEITSILGRLVAGQPAGDALAARIAAES